MPWCCSSLQPQHLLVPEPQTKKASGEQAYGAIELCSASVGVLLLKAILLSVFSLHEQRDPEMKKCATFRNGTRTVNPKPYQPKTLNPKSEAQFRFSPLGIFRLTVPAGPLNITARPLGGHLSFFAEEHKGLNNMQCFDAD